MPTMRQPTTPRGELWYMVRQLTWVGVSNSGARVMLREIGTRDTDTSTEIRMNSSKPAGLATFNRNCPAAMPPSTMTMYTDNSCPRVRLVAASLSQLSTTM